MTAIEPRLRRSYFVRQAILGALFGGMGLMILLAAGTRLGLLGPVAALMGFGAWIVIGVMSHVL